MADLIDDERRLAEIASELADAIDAALASWVGAAVASRAAGLESEAVAAGERCRVELGAAIRALLSTDIDEQRSTPLQLLRRAVPYATDVLAGAGVAPVRRDEFATQIDPEDHYDLTPAAWSDFGPRVAEAGLVWGAAKAHVHLRRRGRR
jgi:hypothetical protein